MEAESRAPAPATITEEQKLIDEQYLDNLKADQGDCCLYSAATSF